jgi:hypothetical protein
MFQITGKIGGNTYKLGFRRTGEGADDFIVSGDDVAVEKLFAESRIDHGSLGLPPGIWRFSDGYLNEETAAYSLACNHVFDEVLEETNDWEPFDPDVVY